MTAHSRRLGILGLLLMATGCGDSSLVKIRGRVVEAGQPVAVPKSDGMLILFHKLKDGKEVNLFPAEFNEEDGSFEVAGPEKKGIPFGSYRVSVSWMERKNRSDKLKGAYTPERTPFKYEIDKSTPEIVLDISGKQG